MNTMTFTVTADEVIGMLATASAGLSSVVGEQITLASSFVANLMRLRAPVGVNGALRDSIDSLIAITPLTATSEIKPHVSYADAVELGSKPHRPPIGPLQAWADMHGINVWALAASIAKKGTQPHPYIQPTYDDTAELVPAIFQTGIEAFLAGLKA